MSEVASARELPVPPGYTSLVPFDREKHRGLGINYSARAELSRTSNAIFLTAPEFFQAARHYPVTFTRTTGDEDVLLCAMVTSFIDGQNRYVTESGEWLPDSYIPAYVRRYPFHAVGVQREGQEPDFLVCVDEKGLQESDTPLFGANGLASKEWTQLEALVRDMEVARRQTRRLLDAIDELGVLEPFEAQGLETEGRALRLRNMWRVDESKLNDLPGGTLKALMAVGALGRIYAHLMSLDNFSFLLERETLAAASAGAKVSK